MPGDESVPLLSAYFPPPHCVQLSSPSPPPIPILFPAGHAVQYEDEGTLAEYFPTGQSVDIVLGQYPVWIVVPVGPDDVWTTVSTGAADAWTTVTAGSGNTWIN